jgi:hypothetical protein
MDKQGILQEKADMARKTRIEFAGAIYHLLDRGDRRWRKRAKAPGGGSTRTC